MEFNTHLTRTGHPTAVSLANNDWLDSRQEGGRQYRPEGEVRFQVVLRRHGRMIAALFLLCLLLAGLATLLMSPKYRAKTLVEVLTVNGDFMNGKDIDPNTSGSTMDSYLETQTKLLTSETVADRVVSSLLPKEAAYVPPSETGVRKLKHLFNRKQSVISGEDAIRQALGSVKVKAEGQSSLISITVVASSAQLASDVANGIADQHIQALQDARFATVTQTAEFLSAQVESQRKKLQVSEDQLQNYARSTGLIYTSDASRDSVASENLREIQADLAKAEADRVEKQSQLELLNASSPENLPKVLDDGSLREVNSHLSELRRQLADLSATLAPGHYKVREVQSQIAALEKQAEQDRGSVMKRMQNDFRAAQRREELQRAAYQKQLALVGDQSGKEVRYNMLKREVDANRDLYQSMLQKIKEAGVVAALRSSNIRVVDPAKPPATPFQPNLLVNLAIGILAAGIFSALYVLLRERGDRSIRTPGESTRLLQVPELAIIPAAKQDIRTQIVGSSTSRLRKRNGSFLQVLSATSSDSSHDIATSWLHTGSLVAESFRSAVTSILLWGRESKLAHKILVVTSAHAGAGKTTTVLNLGLGIAESGRRVLLVDGDLRLSRLGNIFGLNGTAGLSDVLSGALSRSVAHELIREIGVPGLFVLPSGPKRPNVNQLLHSHALNALLEEIGSHFDFILVDTPPAIPLSDARLLARHADGVILVLRAGETSVEQSITLRESFFQDGTYVFGSILNNWDADAGDPAYVKSYLKYARASTSGR